MVIKNLISCKCWHNVKPCTCNLFKSPHTTLRRFLVLVLSIVIIIQQFDDLNAPVANIYPSCTIFFWILWWIPLVEFENRLICISKMATLEGGEFHFCHANITCICICCFSLVKRSFRCCHSTIIITSITFRSLIWGRPRLELPHHYLLLLKCCYKSLQYIQPRTNYT